MATVLVERPSPSECGQLHASHLLRNNMAFVGTGARRPLLSSYSSLEAIVRNMANITLRAEGSTEAGFVVVRPGQTQQVELKIG